MATRILSVVRPLAFKVLLILAVSAGVFGVVQFIRSMWRRP